MNACPTRDRKTARRLWKPARAHFTCVTLAYECIPITSFVSCQPVPARSQALLPGKDYLQQLRLIIETLGEPSASDLAIIENPQAVEYIQALPKKPKVPFSALYPNANPLAIDLLEKMLVFNPVRRNAR